MAAIVLSASNPNSLLKNNSAATIINNTAKPRLKVISGSEDATRALFLKLHANEQPIVSTIKYLE